MQPILPSQIASRPLAALLNVSERAVHLRAKKEGWPRIYKRVQGGSSHLYMVSGLPDEVRSVLVGKLHGRMDIMSEQLSQARGELKGISRSVDLIHQFLLNQKQVKDCSQ